MSNKGIKRFALKAVVLTALLSALCLIFGLTMIGYIPIGPIQITIMCVPVIIGTVMLGKKTGLFVGLFLGFLFGFTSFMQIFIYPNPLYGVLLVDWLSWIKIIAVCFVPRMVIPVTVYFTYNALMKKLNNEKREFIAVGVSAGVGSLTNTVLFLGLFWLLFNGQASQLDPDMYAVFLSIFAIATTINAGCELAFNIIVNPPIVLALRKSVYRRSL